MGDLKPLGSEKLTGDDKLKRILELTYYNQPKKTIVNNKPEIVKESVSGVYGIVKEKDGYYVKKGLTEGTLDYIGGMFMKNKNRFSSYSEALKRMNLLNGQDILQEATKYVLKQKQPTTQEAPMPEPSMDASTPPPTGDSSAPTDMPPADPSMGGDDLGGDDSSGDTDTNGDDGMPQQSKRSDYMGEIQKFAGKLGQELRDQHQKLESDDIKYVLNMIISAVDLDKLEDKDIKDIAKKFKRDDEDTDTSDSPEIPEEPTEPEVPTEPSTPEDTGGNSELGETLSKLNSFINSPAYTEEDTDEVDLSKYADLGDVDEVNMDTHNGNDVYLDEDEDELYENVDEHPNPTPQHSGEEDDIQEIDMDEIKDEINKRIGETLSRYFK